MTTLPPVISTAHEWEGARGGDALERTAAIGRDARDFARRNNLKHTPTDNWQGVAALGKESLRLLRYDTFETEVAINSFALSCSDRPRNERGKDLVTSAEALDSAEDESDWETGDKFLQDQLLANLYNVRQQIAAMMRRWTPSTPIRY
jgi:hypothetical protein